jgi:hypothetical protein
MPSPGVAGILDKLHNYKIPGWRDCINFPHETKIVPFGMPFAFIYLIGWE